MAADEARERMAEEWVENLAGDVGDGIGWAAAMRWGLVGHCARRLERDQQEVRSKRF
jgi:hypothetical protein